MKNGVRHDFSKFQPQIPVPDLLAIQLASWESFLQEDILPENVNFSLIDHFEKVNDKDGAIMARRLAREEGILVGYSAGSAVAGINQLKDNFTKQDVVVVIFHDHGTRYVGKLFNDDWMKEMKFL